MQLNKGDMKRKRLQAARCFEVKHRHDDPCTHSQVYYICYAINEKHLSTSYSAEKYSKHNKLKVSRIQEKSGNFFIVINRDFALEAGKTLLIQATLQKFLFL